jgi:hypothetical protein
MKIIELKDIYDVLSDGVAGENCMVYNVNVFSNMERIYHSPNFTNSSVGEIFEVVSTENFDSRYGGQNSLVSSDMKRCRTSQNQGFR